MSDPVSYPMTASNGGPVQVVRKVNGKAVRGEVTEAEIAAYAAPPSDKYHLRVVGFFEPWVRNKNPKFVKEGGPTTETVTRLEFEIMEGKGKGKRFRSYPITFVVNDKSNLGQVYKATVGPITPSIELTDILDKELVMYVDRNETIDDNNVKTYHANAQWGTAKAVGDESADADDWPAA